MVRKVTCGSMRPAALPSRTSGSDWARATCGAATSAEPIRLPKRRRVIMWLSLTCLDEFDRRFLQRPCARFFDHHQVSDLDGALAVRAHHMRLDHQQHAGLDRERQQLALDHGAGQIGARRLEGYCQGKMISGASIGVQPRKWNMSEPPSFRIALWI